MQSQSLATDFQEQHFANGYELVDGVAMHGLHGEQFQIPHPLLTKHVDIGHFVELRVDSPRFSVHPDAAEQCTCESCQNETSKPILSHQEPASLLVVPPQDVPSRGWGEDFWVRVTHRDGEHFRGVIDNPLYEARLHQLELGTPILFAERHLLAVHGIHRNELVSAMSEDELRQFVQWLRTQMDE